jgi:hypothetical protein
MDAFFFSFFAVLGLEHLELLHQPFFAMVFF